MTIGVKEQIDGRGGTLEAGGSGSEGVRRKWMRKFKVYLDLQTQGLIDVLTATGVPRIGDPFTDGHNTDLGARCYSVEPQSTGEWRVWDVTANYSSDPKDFGDIAKEVAGGSNEPGGTANTKRDPNNPNSKDINDPLAKPAQIAWGEEEYSEVVQKATLIGNADVPDSPVANSAGEPFDPPLEVTRTYLTLTITRNEAAYSSQKAKDFTDSFNSDTFFGFPAGQVKCKSITAEDAFENGRYYWVVKYLFHIRDDWDYSILDAGYFEIVAGQRKEITFPNGRPLPAPWPLDGAGQKLTPAAVQAGSVFYRKFRVGTRKGFAALSLP